MKTRTKSSVSTFLTSTHALHLFACAALLFSLLLGARASAQECSYGGENGLVISNGGTVTSQIGLIGYSTSSNNSVLVTGSNALWTNSLDLYVGYQGSSNSLTISNIYSGGTVVNLRTDMSSLTVENGDTLDLEGTQYFTFIDLNNATLTDGTVRFINLTANGTNNIDATLSGLGVLAINTGVTTLSASNDYTGGTFINMGTLLITNAGTLGATNNSLTIGVEGTLDLGGTTQTQATITVDGTIINGTIINATTGESTTYDSAGNIVQPASN